MRSRFRIRPIDLMVLMAVAGLVGYKGLGRRSAPTATASTFARQVDLSPLHRTAVHADGRLRSFESHAKTFMQYISGPRSIYGQSNGFTYLDMVFRPERYADADMIYIKNKNVRAQILHVLQGHPTLDRGRAEAVMAAGLISKNLLGEPDVVQLLQRLGQDLIRTAKPVEAIQSALTVSDPRFLTAQLRILAPPDGSKDAPWLAVTEASGQGAVPADDVHAGLGRVPTVPGLETEFQEKLAASWTALRQAWRSEDSAAVNGHLATLASLVTTVSPQLYPSAARLATESWYFANKSMTWVWLVYLASVVPLLISVIYRWESARKVGLALFVLAFAAHTSSVGIRWYISGRWPNANMFEAVTTSAWFGGVAALVIEYLARRSLVRNLFALGSAVMSMVALMAAYFLPAQLDSSINNKMAALNDVWLYIHTNVIIWSYAVIGLGCVPALLLLRHRWCVLWDRGVATKARLIVLPLALGVLNYTAYLLLMHVIDNTARGLTGTALFGVTGAFWGALLIVLLELVAARGRARQGIAVERSASGGAAALMGGPSGRSSFLTAQRPAPTEVFDAATMVLVELSFIMLWTGLVMGAIWADHSWGRPWGWDPKEVFALNTFIIFLILIHVRLKVRDKAFWTAVLAVIGFEVMMFNWIVVNFIITGLHSYA